MAPRRRAADPRTGDAPGRPDRDASPVGRRPRRRSAGERVLLLAALDGGRAGLRAAGCDRAADDETAGRGHHLAGGTPPGGPVRLAVVEPTARTLALARKVVARGTPWRGRSDVWFTAEPLLADAGGQGRLPLPRPRARRSSPDVDDVADALPAWPGPDARPATSLVERVARHHRRGPPPRRRPRRAGRHARRDGRPQPGGVDGHDRLRACYERTDRRVRRPPSGPGTLEVPDLVYAALGCGADRAAAAIDGLPDIAVSHDNCPHQSVICGPQPVGRRSPSSGLRADQVMAQPMPFKSGFHSPMLAPYLGPVAGVVRPPAHPPPVGAGVVGHHRRPLPGRPRRGPRPDRPPPARAGALRSADPPPPRRGGAGLRAGRARAASPASSTTPCATATSWPSAPHGGPVRPGPACAGWRPPCGPRVATSGGTAWSRRPPRPLPRRHRPPRPVRDVDAHPAAVEDGPPVTVRLRRPSGPRGRTPVLRAPRLEVPSQAARRRTAGTARSPGAAARRGEGGARRQRAVLDALEPSASDRRATHLTPTSAADRAAPPQQPRPRPRATSDADARTRRALAARPAIRGSPTTASTASPTAGPTSATGSRWCP